MIKKLFLATVCISLIFTNSFSVTYNSDPKIFITELVNDAIKVLGDKSVSKEDKEKTIEKIALENVDIKALGMYTLGEIRKTLDKDMLIRYNKLFEKYFLKSLTSRLNDYASNKFEVLDAEIKSSNYTIVKSKILESSNQPELKIDWRVYTKNKTKPLIRDLIVEGLSLARTQKEEFASILSSNDNKIEGLLSQLEKFISK
jgi:phospholipid transport system substrate-binding protein